MAGRCAKSLTGLITGMLLAGILAAGSAFAAEASLDSDDREVEITYLNDAEPDETVLMEDTTLDGVYAGAYNVTNIETGMNATFNHKFVIVIEGITDQPWTGKDVTLPNLKILAGNYYYDTFHLYYTFLEGEHFTATYKDNRNPGTAKVTLTGLGESYGCSGSVTRTFQIIKKQEENKPDTLPLNSITLPKGTTFTQGSGADKATYTVTGNNTVTFKKSKAGKKAASAKVPDTISFSGLHFMVTKVAKKAFFGMSKLKKVTIGKYVTAIGANAFAKCGKMKTLVIKSASLNASKCKKCLAGSSVKTVKVPASVKKTYKKKIFVKKVCGLKVTVK